MSRQLRSCSRSGNRGADPAILHPTTSATPLGMATTEGKTSMTHINGKVKLARDINRFIEASGGQAIRGLENLSQEGLMEVGGALAQAFDQYQSGVLSGDRGRAPAGEQAMRQIRDVAQFASQAIDRDLGGSQS